MVKTGGGHVDDNQQLMTTNNGIINLYVGIDIGIGRLTLGEVGQLVSGREVGRQNA